MYRHIPALLLALLLVTSAGLRGTPSAQSANSSQYFPETRHTVEGTFLTYWQQQGGLQQQGYPLTDELPEVSDANGQTYTVQYFERAVFESHPENKPPYNVLLSLAYEQDTCNFRTRKLQPIVSL